MNIFINLLLLLSVIKSAQGFIQCPSSGVRYCDSSYTPYLLVKAGNVVISDCVYIGCPQLVISASNVTIRNVTFDGAGLSSALAYTAGGGAVFVFPDTTFTVPTYLSISNCVFKNYYGSNLAAGGAVYLAGGISDFVVIQNSQFIRNKVPGNGGALLALNCPLKMQNCVFSNNSGFDGGAAYFEGSVTYLFNVSAYFNSGVYGGVYNKYSGSDTVIDGGIYQYNYAADFASVIMASSIDGYFRIANIQSIANSADQYASCAYVADSNNITIENVVASYSHSAWSGGAFAIWISNNIIFRNVSVFNCYSNDGGGAIKTFLNGYVLFDSCIFRNNQAISGGGAIAIQNHLSGGSIVEMRNCAFYDNSCPSAQGGAILSDGNSIVMTNCVFGRNLGQQGGVLHVIGPGIVLDISNTAFVNNSAVNNGGTISVDGKVSLLMRNSTILNSVAGAFGGTFYLNGPLESTAFITMVSVVNSQCGLYGQVNYEVVLNII